MIRVLNELGEVVFTLDESRNFEWAWETNYSHIPGPLRCDLDDVKREKVVSINKVASLWANENLGIMALSVASESKILNTLAPNEYPPPDADMLDTLALRDRNYAHKDALVDAVRSPATTDWVDVRDNYNFVPVP